MIDLGKKSILGIGVNAIDYEAAVAKIIAAGRARQSMSVTALAVHFDHVALVAQVLDRRPLEVEALAQLVEARDLECDDGCQ